MKRMRIRIVNLLPYRCAAALAIAILVLASSSSSGETYTNPVIDEIGPAGPSVIFYEGRYYLYPTGDNHSYHVYYSVDLVHWTKGPKVFEPGRKNVWAPDVFRDPKDRRFYLYYTVNKQIGVAVSSAERRFATVEPLHLHRSALV